jgi:hypothetical protein
MPEVKFRMRPLQILKSLYAIGLSGSIRIRTILQSCTLQSLGKQAAGLATRPTLFNMAIDY